MARFAHTILNVLGLWTFRNAERSVSVVFTGCAFVRARAVTGVAALFVAWFALVTASVVNSESKIKITFKKKTLKCQSVNELKADIQICGTLWF